VIISSGIITQWLFLKLLGIVYCLVFCSLYVQIEGLYGSRGVLPISTYVNDSKTLSRIETFVTIPSLFVFYAGDFFLRICAALGIVLSLFLIAGYLQPFMLLLLWILYLSFVSVGQEFLSFQWDALILETGFMSIFFALTTPPPLAIFAFCFFVFRFMFSAGVVKLTSGDPTWRKLAALRYHYETQPLPNPVSWFAHQLPVSFQKFSTLGTFFFELAVPLLALGPAPMRLAGFMLLVFFQGLIFLTGNYGFFNILAVALAVMLLDDRYLSWIGDFVSIPAAKAADPILSGCITGIFIGFLVVNFLQLVMLFYRSHRLSRLMIFLMRFGISSQYGLFAVMTTDRFEFVIEGSDGIREWQAYEFSWKPGDPNRLPGQAAPHQPRLDWQMWFAALDPTYIETWLSNLMVRLLEGSPPVLSLLGKNPFPDAPPDLIRLLVYRYHFTDRQTRRDTGRWWERTLVGTSSPFSL
jgi:hypothetical protein